MACRFKGHLCMKASKISIFRIGQNITMYILLTARSGYLTKRCTPGGGKGDCGAWEPCDSGADCKEGLICFKDKCDYPLS
ncbi:hypothetical protein C2G38_547874 [Gigaspora rosea]|uniref:Uncharacterized protein n=1 Tax=Gigaspora rosea TaxID=44941 RepID=A0A397UAC2_9GLOM|nr:hypothetical protein C2G38_547874 [Gigaspora rosea]